VSLRASPQDVAWALAVTEAIPVRIIRCAWAVGAEPVAISTAYVPGNPVDQGAAEPDPFEAILRAPPAIGPAAVRARAVDLELTPPQPSVARSLRLPPGQPAISVTIRFDDRAAGSPAGLTVVTLKPHYFRVVIQAGDQLPRSAHLME
jgi:DNA-binding GntR family transcriptional regulator